MKVPFSFGGADAPDDRGGTFDPAGAFVPEHLPDPGPFLAGHDVLTGEDHVAFHRTTREVFEERGVYDVTFGYNLARLNLDARHPDAGYRYAADADADEPGVLRAEFTPTTEFCPQSETLAAGSFRAWNGLADAHGYDLVRVRVAPMHHEAERVNAALAELEAAYRDTGSVPPPGGRVTDDGTGADAPNSPF